MKGPIIICIIRFEIRIPQTRRTNQLISTNKTKTHRAWKRAHSQTQLHYIGPLCSMSMFIDFSIKSVHFVCMKVWNVKLECIDLNVCNVYACMTCDMVWCSCLFLNMYIIIYVNLTFFFSLEIININIIEIKHNCYRFIGPMMQFTN